MPYSPRNIGLDPKTLSEFQYLSAKLRAWAAVQHNEDGTHTIELSETVALSIPDDTVSYGQLQEMSTTSLLLGRGTAGPGNPQEIALGGSLAMSGTTLNVANYASTSWTPADGSGATLSFSNVEGTYVQLGPLVLAQGTVTYPATASGSAAVISGLPVTSQNTVHHVATGLVATDAGASVAWQVVPNTKTFRLVSATALTTVANSTLSAKELTFTILYLGA
jgi:hypothetical protein